MNHSAKAGWLTPVAVNTLCDDELEQVLHRWILAITGLPTGRVQPRWTTEQTLLPDTTQTWCAFGVVEIVADTHPALVMGADGETELWRQERVACGITFHGSKGQHYASLFRDGISINQNNDALKHSNLSVSECSNITSFHELVNGQWQRRVDMTVWLGRKSIRTYAIKSFLDADINIIGE